MDEVVLGSDNLPIRQQVVALQWVSDVMTIGLTEWSWYDADTDPIRFSFKSIKGVIIDKMKLFCAVQDLSAADKFWIPAQKGSVIFDLEDLAGNKVNFGSGVLGSSLPTDIFEQKFSTTMKIDSGMSLDDLNLRPVQTIQLNGGGMQFFEALPTATARAHFALALNIRYIPFT